MSALDPFLTAKHRTSFHPAWAQNRKSRGARFFLRLSHSHNGSQMIASNTVRQHLWRTGLARSGVCKKYTNDLACVLITPPNLSVDKH